MFLNEVSMENEDDWTIIGRGGKCKRKKPVVDLAAQGMSFQIHRPNDSIIGDLKDESDDEYEEDRELVNPLSWNKFALIGNIKKTVNDILMKYRIFPKFQIMRLFACLKMIIPNIPIFQLRMDFDKTLENYLKCKIKFISVIPRFTTREYGVGKTIYLIHIRFDWYLMTDTNMNSYEEQFLKDFEEYLGLIGSIHTHIPISKDSNNVTKNRENFFNVMQILKDKRKYDVFQPDYDSFENRLIFEEKNVKSSKTKPYYTPFSEEIQGANGKTYKCKLFLKDAHSGYGEILEDDKIGNKIYLHNRKNCNKAFNEDIVDILVFNNYQRDGDQNENLTGRVVSVFSSDVQPVNKIFLCHIIFGTTSLMKPICNTIPVIYVDNDYAKEQVKIHHENIREMENVINMESVIQTKVKLENAEEFANKSFVTLKKLNKNLQTSVDKIYHVDCFNCNFIFLVLYRKWDDRHRYPYGEVVGLYTPDVRFGNVLHLIKVSCDVPAIGIDEEKFLQNEISKIKILKMKESQKKKEIEKENETEIENLDYICFTFKYPNVKFNEIAYSYRRKTETEIIIGVHVVNLSEFVIENEMLDVCAKNRFFTFLLPNIDSNELNNLQPDYLLSTALTTEYMSIQIGKEVNAISFYFTIDNNNSIVPQKESSPKFLVDKITLNMEIDVNSTNEIIQSHISNYFFLIKIFEFCKNHRIQRVKHIIPPDCFYPNFKLKYNQTAVIIEEELKFLVNKQASIIYNNLQTVDQNLLRKWSSDAQNECNLQYSPLISKKVKYFIPNSRPPILPHRFSKQFLEQIRNNSTVNLFKCESLFPNIGYYHKKWKALTGDDIILPYKPDNSKLLSITNPLSCYLDLALQRILLTGSNYNQEEIENDFSNYEKFKLLFDKYWKICKGYEIRHIFDDKGFMLDCVYEEHSDDRIFFHHPFLDEVNYENFILFQSLNLNKAPINRLQDNNTSFDLMWKTRIFLCNNQDHEDENLRDNIQLGDIYSFELNGIRNSVINSDITDTDIRKIQEILSNNQYKKRITSERLENIDPTMTLNLNIKLRQIMRIQFGYDYSNGIMKIIPELWIINPDFRVCLCHRSDPLKYFMHPQELLKINYKRFHNIKDYKNQFIILNRLEGIHTTINSESSFYIHDLKVDWIAIKNFKIEDEMDLNEDNCGVIILEEEWCNERFLRFVHKKSRILDPVQALHEALFKNNKMDYLLCIQTHISERDIYWIGHCRISDICLIYKDNNFKNNDRKIKKKENLRIHVTFKLVHSSFPIKHEEKQRYSIEVMETPISTRIFERSLRRLRDDTFAANVVMKQIHLNTDMDLSIRGNTNLMYGPDELCRNISEDTITKCSLNTKQKEALYNSTRFNFTLIWGPPGTGKTLVGCMIAYWYTKINQNKSKSTSVLYCGPSNQSVDVVAEKLMKTFGDKCPKLLRIFNKDVVNYDFPYAGAQYKSSLHGCPESLKCIALHHIVRLQGKPYSIMLNEYKELFAHVKRRREMDRLSFSAKLKKYERCLKKAFETEIEEGQYEIILTTAAGSCRKLLENEKLIFSQVILDECGMCSEPEALGPMLNKNELENLVLIGDHKQLRPIITCTVAKGKQMNTSLFERLYSPDKEYCIMLDTQYRMHPSICEFPSIHFYGDTEKNRRRRSHIYLKTACCENWTGIPEGKVNSNFNGLQYVSLYKGFERDLQRNIVNIADEFWKKGGKRRKNFVCYPKFIDFNGPAVYEKILFINVVGVEINQEVSCSTGSTKSKGNDQEANAVEYVYKKLIEKIFPMTNAVQSILVITQYRLQESNLKIICDNILREKNISGVPRVSTVVKSQGSESEYVIFSTVRSLPNLGDIDRNPTPGWISKYLGFITDENQFNVALTRAKKGLFIIGNSQLLSVDPMWKALITDLKERKCFLDSILTLH